MVWWGNYRLKGLKGNQTLYSSIRISSRVRWWHCHGMELFCCFAAIDQEKLGLRIVSGNSRRKCQGIRPWNEGQQKVGLATKYQPNTQRSQYQKTFEVHCVLDWKNSLNRNPTEILSQDPKYSSCQKAHQHYWVEAIQSLHNYSFGLSHI